MYIVYNMDDTLLTICSCIVFFGFQNGVTPLRMIAEAGHRDIVTLLLEHGANPNLSDKVIGNYLSSWTTFVISFYCLLAFEFLERLDSVE